MPRRVAKPKPEPKAKRGGKANQAATKSESGKHPGGRPTKYKAEYADLARKFCLLGATNAELAQFFDVAESSIKKWMAEIDEFSAAIKEGREVADAKVGQRLYERALGYSHAEDKIFNANGAPLIVPTTKHYPPDTTAAIFWLKNRQPERWRDRQDHNVHGPGGGPARFIIDISGGQNED